MEWPEKFLSEGSFNLWRQLAVQLHFSSRDGLYLDFKLWYSARKEKNMGKGLVSILPGCCSPQLKEMGISKARKHHHLSRYGVLQRGGKFPTWCFWRTLKSYPESQNNAIYWNKSVSVPFHACNTYLCTFEVDKGGLYVVLWAWLLENFVFISFFT